MSHAPGIGCELFALGHAVVDVEFSVSRTLLTDLGYTPGGRYLIDEGQFHILHAALQAPGAEAEWVAQSGGGSAANAIVTAQRLGARCHFAGKLARDAAGWFYQQTLQNEGIELPDTPLADGTSGHCLVLVTPDAERTMLLHLGVTTRLDSGYIDLQRLRQSRYLFLESYLVTDAIARQSVEAALEVARAAEIPVCLSLSDPDIVHHWRMHLEDWLHPPITTLLGNEAEALAWTGQDSLEEAMVTLGDLAEQVVITRGAAGALIRDRSGQQAVTAPSVNAVSSLGAGDTFAGALLYGLCCEQWSLSQATVFASRCAARKVEFNGPRLAREQLIWVYSQYCEDDNAASGETGR